MTIDIFKRFKVYLVDPHDNRAGEIDDFRSLTAKQIWNNVGTWSMELDRSSSKLVPLTTPMYGIDIWDTALNQSFLRGLIDTREQKYDATTDTLTVTGWDDNQWLNWRLAHPSPTEGFPPYTVQAYDVRTGQASNVIHQYADVNFGPNAFSSRIVTPVPSFDVGLGATITGRARFEVLLPFLQDLALQAGTDVGFRVRRYPPTGQMQFITYGPTDRTDTVIFSVKLGNLTGGTIKATSPKATYVYAAGSGDLTARIFAEVYDPVTLNTWGRREYFYDVNNTSSTTELTSAGNKALVDQGEQADFELVITDTQSMTYGIDYLLGDKVTGVFVGKEPVPILSNSGVIQELIREIELAITPTDTRITPKMGTPDKKDIFRTFREIRQLRTELKKRQNN